MPDHRQYPDHSKNPLDLSIVVPIFNEEGNIGPLWDEIRATLDACDYSFELIFVDDGSTDGSRDSERRIMMDDPRIRTIFLKRHSGKTEALATGFKAACGNIIIIMDADLQDVPAEIPRFIEKIDQGFDVVCGWKQNRQDSTVKVLQSRLFNSLISKISGVRLHDHNCGFKALSSNVIHRLDLYGEQHRLITVLADAEGFRVTEIPVHHRARIRGHSKYGWGRILDGLLDLLTVVVAIRYQARPLHIFGKTGLFFLLIGTLAGLYLAGVWTFNELGIGNGEGVGTRPLLFASVLSILFGMQLIGIGLLAEIMVRMNRRNNRTDRHMGEEIELDRNSSTNEFHEPASPLNPGSGGQ